MKKSEVILLIKQPEIANSGQIQGIQDVLSEYPYFTSAQILLTKAYFQSENINYEKQLRLTAAYASDRKRLHELIYDQGIEDSNGFEEQAEVVDQKEEGTLEVSDEKEVIIEGPGSLSEEDAFLESQIMTSAINSSVLLEAGDDEEGLKEAAEEIKRTEEFEEKESEAFNESSSHSFSGWIKHYSSDQSTSNKESSSTSSQMIQSISEQAKNIQKKAEFFSASKMAKLSVTESDDLVTETLAQVYEAQGKFERAIQAYEKLQLKYPEKRVYFAGRIKAVEEKLKS